MTPLLRLEGVGWRTAMTSILEDIDLEVRAGEFVALMGRNGAGKSTLLDLTARLRKPTSGAVMLEGRLLETWTSRELAQTVSHLPQIVRGDVTFSAEQLVLMGRYPSADGWFESEADESAVADAMARCGCLEFRERSVTTLSGGERQRVLVSACLAQQPKLLLLDEPATFLDVDQQLHCFQLLREEVARGTTCIAVTHDLNLALTYCTRLVVLANKGIARDVTTHEALARPDWLQLFSSRLEATTTPSGRPFVCYE